MNRPDSTIISSPSAHQMPALDSMRRDACRPLTRMLITLIGLISFSAVHAEPSIPVVPGKYEMVNDLVESKNTNCFKGDKLSAEVIRAQMKDQGGNEQCKIVDSRLEGDQLVLDMACQYDANEKGSGTMQIGTSGETITVKSVFRLIVEGQERSMEMTSVGKRIGGC
ncbi:MAG: DUF3617 domain-containing protein [Burkholderiaceae bacterium]